VPTDLRGVTQAAGGYAWAAAVTQAPMFLTPPASDTVPAGSDTEFVVRLLNEPNAQLQWRLNDVELPGATNTWLRMTNVQARHAGTYAVTASSARWDDAKTSASLQVRPAKPWFLELPQDQSVHPGESVTFRCVARGTEPVSYTWLRDGHPIEGAAQPTLTLPFVAPRDSGYYAVFAQNEVGTSAMPFAFLQVLASGELLSPCLDTKGAFSVRLSVDPGRSYRVQTSPDLVNWEEWLHFVSADGSFGLLDPRATASPARFYRLVSP